MISAADPAFWQQYPNGCRIYDRLGRRLCNVVSFNPETGEVVVCDRLPLVGLFAWLRGNVTRRIWPFKVDFAVHFFQLNRRHGFWPAPLQVVPRLAVHIGFEADEDPAT
jgi:hypothetical protein